MLTTGISTGCAPDLFCTHNAVTRGEMAAFLDRALDLPATPEDFFDDDDGSTFEISINRLAAAGITSGCGVREFCPQRNISRGEMAAFLARAFELSPGGEDHYPDDDGSMFEDSINAITDAGIATGCTSTRYCPTAGQPRPDGRLHPPRPGLRRAADQRQVPGLGLGLTAAAPTRASSMIRHASASPSQPFTSVWRFSRVL